MSTAPFSIFGIRFAEFLSSLIASVTVMFRSKNTRPIAPAEEQECVLLDFREAKTKPRRRPAKRGIENPASKVTLKNLLQTLDDTISLAQLPWDKFSWVSRRNIAALKKLGIHAIYGMDDYREEGETLNAGAMKTLPGIFAIDFGMKKYERGDTVYLSQMFGIKEKKLSVYLDPCKGTHYLFGMGIGLGVKNEADKEKEQMWFSGYITVRPNGNIHLHRESSAEVVTIPIKSQTEKINLMRVLSML